MTNTELFEAWNEALFSHFFPVSLEEDEEVCLYITKEDIDDIGQKKGLGGYDQFMQLIFLPIDDRKHIFLELWKKYVGTELSQQQRRKLNNTNLFEFATIYTDKALLPHLNCPFLVFVVFVVLMGDECFKKEKRGIGIGNYITKRLRKSFPTHSQRRGALDVLFNALADNYPHFRAGKQTEHKYIGLIRYQLVLSKTQEDSLKKAMYSADLSEELPYNLWALRLRDYLEQSMKELLDKSLNDSILRQRISNIRNNFDPFLYEQTHQNEDFCSKGSFVLAVYEDDYSEENDKLVLLTDINNKTISDGNLKIVKGTIDRLGDFAQYNINHVLIGPDGNDRAEMKRYSLTSGENRIKSGVLGNLVFFSRSSGNYLIQADYSQIGKETYILVKHGCEEDWSKFLSDHKSSAVKKIDENYVRRVFGEGWVAYSSSDLEFTLNTRRSHSNDSSIIMDGGIRCVGMNNVYLVNAMPYFEFSEPIDLNKLEVFVKINGEEYKNPDRKIVDRNKLFLGFPQLTIGDCSSEVSITIKCKNSVENSKVITIQEKFSIIGQDVKYNEDDLFSVDMWGNTIPNGEQKPYMKGFMLDASLNRMNLPANSGLYQNQNIDHGINTHDPRFCLVNLFAAICSMKKDFSVTEKQLWKCIRYAAVQNGLNIVTDTSFYRNLRYLLINSGYINADYNQGRYQPIPPTFMKVPIGLIPGKKLYMLSGAYTNKFLIKLVNFCTSNNAKIFAHNDHFNGDIANALMPPVILIYNFNPTRFKEITGCQCMCFNQEDVAINMLRALPTYKSYEQTLRHTPKEVFDTPLTNCDIHSFPRHRESRATGYGSSHWIEKRENDFYRVTIKDTAWAKLFCVYMRQETFCIKDQNSLVFPLNIHLPLMMQRALFLTNIGSPKKEKAFICFNTDSANNYYNLVKRYEIKDATTATRINHVIQSVTGKPNDESNASVRTRQRCPHYRLYLWKNQQKQSNHPRSLLVLTDQYGNRIHGFAIKGKDTKVFFDVGTEKPRFQRVNGDDINLSFSKFLTSRVTWEQLGISFENEYMKIPPIDNYDKEEVVIM